MSFTGRHIVLVEDDATMGHSLVQRLELEGARVTWVKQMVRGISAIRTPRHPVDAVVCDIGLPDGTGEDILAAVAGTITPPPFLFITGQGEIGQAVRLLKAGATDYLTKPFELSTLLERLTSVFSSAMEGHDLPESVGISTLARRLEGQIKQAAAADGPVLVKGERGLGKMRIARRLLKLSGHPENGISEINGFDTSGDPDWRDLDDDEALIVSGVERLPEETQRRLLATVRNPDRRVIVLAVTSAEGELGAGGVGEDLYYALSPGEIVVPPLRQRPEDAVWLANKIFNALNARRANPLSGLSDLSLTALREHDWPGNGREVRSRVVRAVSAPNDGWVHPVDLFPELDVDSSRLETLAEVRDAAERRQIQRALVRTGGQMTESARLLRVSRTTLWEKMQKLNL